MDYQALRDEIDTDPKGLGYSGKTPQEIADLLNAVGGSGETVNRGVISAYLVMNEIFAADLDNITSDARSKLQTVLSPGEVDCSNSNIKQILGSIFSGYDNTTNALLALAQRSASRAEVLGLPALEHFHVERALAL